MQRGRARLRGGDLAPVLIVLLLPLTMAACTGPSEDPQPVSSSSDLGGSTSPTGDRSESPTATGAESESESDAGPVIVDTATWEPPTCAELAAAAPTLVRGLTADGPGIDNSGARERGISCEYSSNERGLALRVTATPDITEASEAPVPAGVIDDDRATERHGYLMLGESGQEDDEDPLDTVRFAAGNLTVEAFYIGSDYTASPGGDDVLTNEDGIEAVLSIYDAAINA